MNLFADENLEGQIVEWLRSQGHDVSYAAEMAAGQPDTDILDIALNQGRIILTSDLDFGELVFHRKLVAPGIVLLRLKGLMPPEKLQTFIHQWNVVQSQVAGKFTVISATKIRIRSLA